MTLISLPGMADVGPSPPSERYRKPRMSERETLHRIAVGLHKLAATRPLTTVEVRMFVLAQEALTPETSHASIVGYLEGRR